MFGACRKKVGIVAALSLAVLAALWLFSKKGNGGVILIPELKNFTQSISSENELLSYTKRPFSWHQRLNEDGSVKNFDLFTPPSVYRQNGTFIIKTYDTLIIDDALPLYLSSISPKPYRLKIEGYSRSNNDNGVTIMFRDIETGKYGDCVLGDRNEELKLQVRSFETQGYEKDGIYYEIPVVTVYDEVARKEFSLTNEQKFLDAKYMVTIKDIDGNEYVLRDTGSSVKIGEATCTLRSFNQNEGTAKLLLRDAHGQEFHKTVHLIR